MSKRAAELYIGLMSGTSMDGIDAAVIDLSQGKPCVIATHEHPIPKNLQYAITPLFLPGKDSIDALGSADQQLGECFAEAVITLLKQANLNSEQIVAIGSHGQTVRHRPPGINTPHPFTLQIGDPNIIAARTGITTVADFRRRDIAFGGQAAPLVPAFHQAMFHSASHSRAIINIGGISNITYLPSKGKILGFDTGPGNGLLDAWTIRHRNQPFDRDGQWASQHMSSSALLAVLKNHPFLQRLPPKSTGREDFNLPWLEQQLQGFDNLNPGCVQATLLQLTTETIVDAIQLLPTHVDEIFICGGGALNKALMASLTERCKPSAVDSTTSLGISPEWVEAAAFAWLARQTIARLPGNVPAVTGASKFTVLGGIYLG